MRTDTPERNTGGLARLSVQRLVLPQVRRFIGREQEIPCDYDGLLAAIAPRPVFVVQPTMDRDATPADVHAVVDQLGFDEPNDYQRRIARSHGWRSISPKPPRRRKTKK